MPRADDVRRIVSGGRQRGLSDDQIRALVARYDQRQAPEPAQAPASTERVPVAGRGTQFNQQRAERNFTEALPTAGAMAGGFAGSAIGPAGSVAGAGVGGALGTGAQSLFRGETPDVGQMATRGVIDAGAQVAGGVAAKGLALAGRGLYKGGVALLPRTLKEAHPKIAETGLREGIALTKRGAAKAGEAVKASAGQADEMIAAAERSGAAPIDPMEVVRELRPVGQKIRTQTALGMADEMPALTQRAKAFTSRGPIPLTRAQAMKREAQDLATTAYKARDKGAVINNLEALTNEAQARGLRKSLESRVGGLGDVNARTQALMGLREGAEHASGTGHILTRLGAGGLGAGLASAGGAAPALGATAGGILLGTPGGLTAAGTALSKMAPLASHVPQASRLAILMQLLSQQDDQTEQ